MSIQAEHTTPRFELRHRLHLAMETADLGPDDMAQEIGRSVTTIRNYLSGRTHPSRGVVVAWAFRCGVDVDWLEHGIERTGPSDQGNAASRCSVLSFPLAA